MPHEVIMPALGMAQESGQIVAWLKQPGDAVRTGDALMEVETDKATMEVEADADGFLTDVRAAAGQSVPVGNVVAMISSSAEGADNEPEASVPTEGDTVGDEDARDRQTSPVEGREVIMPALGMSQESGKIVAWLKAPGDPVGVEDVLFEVETDKAVTEVQAGHDGWLAETRGQEGDDIPVGEVIAIVSTEKPAAPRALSRSASAAAGSTESTPETRAAPTPEWRGPASTSRADAPARSVAAPRTGRVLASPKARRLAAERGLDLGRLAGAGHEPPFHVADLETLAALPAPATSVDSAATARIEAEVAAAALTAFCDWAEADGSPVTPGRAVAAFAAAALRQATGRDVIRIALSRPGHAAAVLADLDRLPLGAEADTAEAAPDLVLRDLSGSRLTAVTLGTAVPTLTLGVRGESHTLTLEFDAASLDPDAAMELLAGLTARIEDPLRHLL